jgi:5'-nucleotidase
MRALVTNDDGIESPGLHALAAVAVDAGLDVVVAAPSWDSSGASASLTSVLKDGRFMAAQRRLPGLEVAAYAVEGSPGFITMVAANGAFGPKPSIVLSGINHGLNTGHAVLHSGTVGAALTGSTFGMRGLAVSIEATASPEWDTAAALARRVLAWLVHAEAPVVMNLNVPSVAASQVRGLRRGSLAKFGAVQTSVVSEGEARKISYAPVEAEHDPATDAGLVELRYASVTPLVALCESAAVDTSALTDAAGSGTHGPADRP